MFERFTDRARRVVVLAQEEARLLDHNYIGTEHLLLGLIDEGEGVACRTLESLGVDADRIRNEVVRIVGRGPEPTVGHVPFTPQAKKILELALREALQMGHNYIGTEHILLGLIRVEGGVSAEVLEQLGVDADRVRQTVVQLLSGDAGTPEGEPASGTFSEDEESQQASEAPVSAAVRSDGLPTCPVCRVSLIEWLSIRTIDAQGVDSKVPVTLVFCGACGAALQVVP